jgi:putative endonuclease
MVSVVQALGRFGEDVAVEHLQQGGVQILDRRWRCPEGELDIVVRDGATVAFVEVKTRSGVGFGTPAEAVTPVKLRRLRRLAWLWLAAHDEHPLEVRIDVVSVLRTPGGVTVEHLKAVG